MVSDMDDQEILDIPQIGEDDEDTTQIPKSVLVSIIQPRLEEIFEMIRERLEMSGIAHLIGRRLVLTGGACQMPGMRDFAGMMMSKQVRIGRPGNIPGLADSTNGPAFSTCAGLLIYASGGHPAVSTFNFSGTQSGSLMGRLSSWLSEYL
jgi:cell division protein FtsA